MIPFRKVPMVYVALSGGMDSVAVFHYYYKRGSIKAAIWYDHDNEVSKLEKEFVTEFCKFYDVELIIGTFLDLIEPPKPSTSKENYWSACRNTWFNQFDLPVVTGHNLSDAIEWYLMTCLTGEGHYMHWQNKNVLRPFLTTPKRDMEQYCLDHNLAWFEDDTNADVTFTARNRIRHRIIPEIDLMPGNFETVVKKNIIRKNS